MDQPQSQSTTKPGLENEANLQRRANALRVLNFGWLLMGGLAVLSLPFYPEDRAPLVIIVVMAFSTFFSVHGLIHRHRRIAGAVFSIAADVMFLMYFLAQVSQLGEDVAFDRRLHMLMMMGLGIIFAGSLIHKSAALIMAGANSAALIILYLALGVSTTPPISVHVFWWMLALSTWLYENYLEQTLASLQDHRLNLETRVTERTRQLEEARIEAEKANQQKSQFLAKMSHELRTPLNAIINFTQFVSSGLYGPVNDKQVDSLNKTTFSARHLLSLINDILDMSKIEAEQMVLLIEKDVDLLPEVSAVIETTRPLLVDKPVTLVDEIAPDLPHIVGDRRRIRQILLNLTANAVKFTDSGQITVRAWCDDDQVHFAVKDTGPGIAPEDQITIFEPFRQVARAAGKTSGTGLGLPISRWLAESHGGKLWVESVVGQGAVFRVALPICAPELLAQAEAKREA